MDSINFATAITPSDVAVPVASDLAFTALYVGVAGDVKVKLYGGSDFTFPGLMPGVFHRVRFTKVYATGTTATGVIGGR